MRKRLSISFIKYFPLIIVALAILLSTWVYFEEKDRVIAWVLIFLNSVIIYKETQAFFIHKSSPWLKE